MFTPSKYQKDIFSWATEGKGNCIVQAVPGSGKSTTLIEVSKLLPSDLSIRFLAFNKHIADKLEAAVPSYVKVSTIHSLGMASLMRRYKGHLEVVYDKYKYLLKGKVNQAIDLSSLESTGSYTAKEIAVYKHQITENFFRVFDLARANLVTQTNVREFLNAYSSDPCFDYWKEHRDTFQSLMLEGYALGVPGRNTKAIDFTDMIWLPNYLPNLTIAKVDFVLVDEAQDLSLAQLELVLKTLKRTSRALFVGDRHQAIMQFAGASVNSMDIIKKRTKAIELPLSICYRCPVSNVKLAQQIYSEIEAYPSNPRGVLKVVSYKDYLDLVNKEDFVIHRNNEALFIEGIMFLGLGKCPTFKALNIVQAAIDFLQQLTKQQDVWMTEDEFYELCTKAYFLLVEKEKTKAPDEELVEQSEADRVGSMLSGLKKAYSYYKCNCTSDLVNHLYELKQSKGLRYPILSTIHSCKGLETDRVFFLDFNYYSNFTSLDAKNLVYVGLTRAKKELYLVETEATIEKAKELLKEKKELDELTYKLKQNEAGLSNLLLYSLSIEQYDSTELEANPSIIC